MTDQELIRLRRELLAQPVIYLPRSRWSATLMCSWNISDTERVATVVARVRAIAGAGMELDVIEPRGTEFDPWRAATERDLSGLLGAAPSAGPCSFCGSPSRFVGRAEGRACESCIGALRSVRSTKAPCSFCGRDSHVAATRAECRICDACMQLASAVIQASH